MDFLWLASEMPMETPCLIHRTMQFSAENASLQATKVLPCLIPNAVLHAFTRRIGPCRYHAHCMLRYVPHTLNLAGMSCEWCLHWLEAELMHMFVTALAANGVYNQVVRHLGTSMHQR